MTENSVTHNGDHLLEILSALDNPHRLRILASLVVGGRNYVSQLARDAGINRPLMHLHLKKLEKAGLIISKLELSSDGKALNYYEVADFTLNITPQIIAEAAITLTSKNET